MNRPIRVLVVEDSESDAALIARHLEKADYEVQWERVDTAGDMKDALASQVWDVVISDCHLPQFDASAALATLKGSGLDIPFIVVSGMIGEETAAGLMKGGAQDFLKKENLARLGPAVAREIAEAHDRALRRKAEAALRESETRFQTLVEMAPEAIFIGSGGHFAYVNGAAQRLIGASSPGELLGRPILDFLHPDFYERVSQLIRLVNEERQPVAATEVVCIRLDGTTIHVEASAVPFNVEGEHGSIVFAHDISERKRSEAALAEQVRELRRWYEATLGRETRILELKQEVNQLLVEAGKPARYVSAGASAAGDSKP